MLCAFQSVGCKHGKVSSHRYYSGGELKTDIETDKHSKENKNLKPITRKNCSLMKNHKRFGHSPYQCSITATCLVRATVHLKVT